ncbi:MAG: hypothetical protein ABIX01_20670 [Chitinophagaceae bacterium]
MKIFTKLFVAASLLPGINFCNAQAIGIGTSTPAASAALDVTSTNKGLLLPRLTDTSAVASPTAGLLIYNNKTKTPLSTMVLPGKASPDSTSWTPMPTQLCIRSAQLTALLRGHTGLRLLPQGAVWGKTGLLPT